VDIFLIVPDQNLNSRHCSLNNFHDGNPVVKNVGQFVVMAR
jgi:hypothetical protein